MRDLKDNEKRFFSEVKDKKKIGNSCKLQQGKFQTGLRKKFFMVSLRTTQLHRGTPGFPAFRVFKT